MITPGKLCFVHLRRLALTLFLTLFLLWGQEKGTVVGASPSTREDGAVRLAIALPGSLQNPAWSPDGTGLLFTRFRNGYNKGPADLYIFQPASGSLRCLLADGSVNVNLPGSSWKPGAIVYSSSREPHDEIYSLPDTGGKRGEQLTRRPALAAYEPSLSPDLRRLAFESHRVDEEGGGKIVIKDLARPLGEGYADITAAGDFRQPNWAPGGDLIVCQGWTHGQWDVFLLDIRNGMTKRLTTDPGDETDPSFSPDDWFVVYSADGSLAFANLFIIPVQGGAARRLSFHDSGYDGAPAWSPNGTQVAFESCRGDPDRSTGTQIWVMPVADSLLQPVPK